MVGHFALEIGYQQTRWFIVMPSVEELRAPGRGIVNVCNDKQGWDRAHGCKGFTVWPGLEKQVSQSDYSSAAVRNVVPVTIFIDNKE
jgi:hypothetical protein